MNKASLIQSMHEKCEDLTKKEVETVLNAFMVSVEEALVAGDKVQLIGFGSFETKERAARQGKNPRNPEEVIEIPSRVAPIFKAGKSLKEAVNK